MGDYAGWNTEDELRYIDNIGLNNPQTLRRSHADILKCYREGVMRRAKWDAIDRRQVLAYLASKLSL